jgi:putative transposase
MGTPRYTEEFKAEAVGQILERGYSVKEVAERIGVSTHSLYKWLKADSRKPVQMRYAFIKDYRAEYRAALMCRVLRVHRSGFYAWLQKPKSCRALEDERLLTRIRYFRDESGQT